MGSLEQIELERQVKEEAKQYGDNLSPKELQRYDKIESEFGAKHPAELDIWHTVWDEYERPYDTGIPEAILPNPTMQATGLRREKAKRAVEIAKEFDKLIEAEPVESLDIDLGDNPTFLRPVLPEERPDLYVDNPKQFADRGVWESLWERSVFDKDEAFPQSPLRSYCKSDFNIQTEEEIDAVIEMGKRSENITLEEDRYELSSERPNKFWIEVWEEMNTEVTAPMQEKHIITGIDITNDVSIDEAIDLFNTGVKNHEMYSPPTIDHDEYMINDPSDDEGPPILTDDDDDEGGENGTGDTGSQNDGNEPTQTNETTSAETQDTSSEHNKPDRQDESVTPGVNIDNTSKQETDSETTTEDTSITSDGYNKNENRTKDNKSQENIPQAKSATGSTTTEHSPGSEIESPSQTEDSYEKKGQNENGNDQNKTNKNNKNTQTNGDVESTTRESDDGGVESSANESSDEPADLDEQSDEVATNPEGGVSIEHMLGDSASDNESASTNTEDEPDQPTTETEDSDHESTRFHTYKPPADSDDGDVDEHALNQFVEHHATVGEPDQKQMKTGVSNFVDIFNEWAKINSIQLNKLSEDEPNNMRKSAFRTILNKHHNIEKVKARLDGKQAYVFRPIILSEEVSDLAE